LAYLREIILTTVMTLALSGASLIPVYTCDGTSIISEYSEGCIQDAGIIESEAAAEQKICVFDLNINENDYEIATFIKTECLSSYDCVKVMLSENIYDYEVLTVLTKTSFSVPSYNSVSLVNNSINKLSFTLSESVTGFTVTIKMNDTLIAEYSKAGEINLEYLIIKAENNTASFKIVKEEDYINSRTTGEEEEENDDIIIPPESGDNEDGNIIIGEEEDSGTDEEPPQIEEENDEEQPLNNDEEDNNDGIVGIIVTPDELGGNDQGGEIIDNPDSETAIDITEPEENNEEESITVPSDGTVAAVSFLNLGEKIAYGTAAFFICSVFLFILWETLKAKSID